MRKVFLGIAALAMAFTSCTKTEVAPVEKGSVEKGTEFVASLGLQKGGISVNTDEMNGGGTEGEEGGASAGETPAAYAIDDNDLIGIEIKKADDATLVASGLFAGSTINDTQNPLKVFLEHGVKYTVEATLVSCKNGNKSLKKPFNKTEEFGNVIGVDKWTVKQDEELKAFADLTAINTDVNALSERDRFYSKKEITADYQNPDFEITLKRVSCAVVPTIYNVGENCYVEGKIYVGADASSAIKNFPKDVEENVGVTSGECGIPKTFTIGGKEITAKCYSQERIFVLSDIANAYALALDNKADKSVSPINVEFTVNTKKNNGDGTYNVTVLRTLKATIDKPLPNKKYTVYVDASTEKENAITITATDAWEEATDPIVATEEKEVR